jgi:rubrerythrin
MVATDDIEGLRKRGDSAVLGAALQLEEEAVARYREQAATTCDPRLFAYWEALRRNESEHRDDLRRRIEALAAREAAR